VKREYMKVEIGPGGGGANIYLPQISSRGQRGAFPTFRGEGVAEPRSKSNSILIPV